MKSKTRTPELLNRSNRPNTAKISGYVPKKEPTARLYQKNFSYYNLQSLKETELSCLSLMVIRVVEFLSGGYKIGKIFA